ncbi:hypothetical protein C0991_011747, partial [Blastosporella zonata]
MKTSLESSTMSTRSSASKSDYEDPSYTNNEDSHPGIPSKRQHPLNHTSSLSPSPDKKAKVLRTTSSIRAAVLASKDTMKPKGLLAFFSKASEAECQASRIKDSEDICRRADDIKLQENKLMKKDALHKTNNARERKQKQRKKEKNTEIQKGLRSPSGHKYM